MHFIDRNTDLSASITGTFDPMLVVLSVAVASIAGYTALLLSERISNGARSRLWLSGGAFSMGCGIWTMHFVGMLAFSLPVPVSYDVWVTLASLVPGVLGSGVALRSMSHQNASWLRLNGAGLLMGSAIGTMHYTGMAAMVIPAHMLYSPTIFACSILVAHVFATLGLSVKFGLRRVRIAPWQRQALGGVILGCAVSGMHYTGMMAVVYLPGVEPFTETTSLMSPVTLGVTVSLFATIVLATTIIAVLVDRRLQEVSEHLLESESRNRLIMETVAEGIIGIDASGIVTYVNAAAGSMFGYRSEDIVGRNVKLLMPAETAERHDEYLARYAATREPHVIALAREVQAIRSDGSRFPAMLKVGEYTLGGHSFFAGLIRDLTVERMMQAQLLQSQKLESVGRLAAGIAHEINTPTQFVGDNLAFLETSFSQIIELFKKFQELTRAARTGRIPPGLLTDVERAEAETDAEFLCEEIPRGLEESRGGIQRVAEIVAAMKAFAQPGSEHKQLADLNRVIENTVAVARSEWRYAADVELDLEQGLPDVPCLVAELGQVLLNILINAAHAIGDARDPENQREGRICLRTRCENDQWVVIEISDNGPGIPEEIQSKVFDPFFTTKDVGRGTGQGLSIAWSIVVEKHGGSLDLQSQVGSGTTFTIRLPIAM